MRYVWLVYLGALFYQPVFNPSTDAWDWLAVAVLIAVFLPIYAATFRARDDRQILILVAGLGASPSLLRVRCSTAGPACSSSTRRPRPVACTRPPGRARGRGARRPGRPDLRDLPVPMPWRLAAAGPALLFTPVVGAASIFDSERSRANQRLLRADEEIERLATIAERERIARDLHDLLGHTLSVIVLKSELAARLVRSDPDRATAEVKDIEHIGREALGEVRAAVAGYRARGIGAELDGARMALEAAGVDVEVHADPTDLPPEQESALAMALREAVTNVVRHADARRATITITTVGTDVRLEVSDDGRGSAGLAGSGITGMRERIAASVAMSGWVTHVAATPARDRRGGDRTSRPDGRRQARRRGDRWAMTITVVLAEDQLMVLGALSTSWGWRPTSPWRAPPPTARRPSARSRRCGPTSC